MTLRNPILDVNTEIEASVKDLAGNETRVKWTVDWLLTHSKKQLH